MPEVKQSTQQNTRFPLEFRIVALTMWLTYGFSTLFNALALLPWNNDYQRGAVVQLPDNMQQAIWLVLSLWLSGYLAALLTGVISHIKDQQYRPVLYSTITGYLLAVSVRLILINVFPIRENDIPGIEGTPILPGSAYDVFYGLITFSSSYTYHNFLFLVLIVGPVLVTLATLTGHWISLMIRSSQPPAETETPAQKINDYIHRFARYNIRQIQVDQRAVLTTIMVSFALLFMFFGLYNLFITDLNNDPVFSSIEIAFNPATSILIASVSALLIGISDVGKQQQSTVLSTTLGLIIYLQILVIFKQWLVSYPEATGVEYENPMNPLLPNQVYFHFLWYGVILTGVLIVYTVSYMRGAGLQETSLETE